MKPLASQFSDKETDVVAPDAPNHTWYPSPITEQDLDDPYLTKSIQSIHDLISSKPKSQIYLVGFSQGACLALEVAARFPAHYGGIIAFSGALIGSMKGGYQGDLKGTKIFIGLSEEDPYLPLTYAKKSKKILTDMGAEVLLKTYPGAAHTIRQNEIKSAKEFIFKDL